VTGERVLRALQVPRRGRVYDLEVTRERGMPQWPGHPAFEVMTFRSPLGLRVQADQEWLLPENNAWNAGFISDFVMGSTHTGTHVDALSHATAGPDSHWYGGHTPDAHLGDFGPLTHDAAAIPPIVARGVLIDIARHTGVERLPAGYGISADELAEAAEAQGVAPKPGGVVLIRTGQMSVWPDQAALAETGGAGVDAGAARWLVEHAGSILVGSDTEALEQVPAADPQRPSPVHRYLLVEQGVYIAENVYLEELARDGVGEFLLVIAPLKIRGATGSLVRPLAIT
jgi:kynurenine formamidase